GKSDSFPVEIHQKINGVTLCLKNLSANYANAILYDDNSYIRDFKVYNNFGRSASSRAIISKKTYEQNGIFYSDAKIYTYVISHQGLGDKTSFELTKVYKDPKYLTSVFFHQPYPSQTITVRFIIPDWMDVELKEMNINGYEINRTKSYNEKRKETTYDFSLKDLEQD